MEESIEKIVKDRIINENGKSFQELFWNIAMCCYDDLQTPKMRNDLGNDGYSIDKKCFFAVYAPETQTYDNNDTVNKIAEDYDKFVLNWKILYDFSTWYFVTKDNLMGLPHQKLVDLNNNGDGVKKENIGLNAILNIVNSIDEESLKRIFMLPDGLFSDRTVSEEVKIFMDLISYISKNKIVEEKDFNNIIPDPENKIYKRFAKYCDILKAEISNGPIFSKAIKDAENAIGLDTLKTAMIVAELRNRSSRFLFENDNNPITALNKLTDYYEEKISLAKGKFSSNAIRYYLIYQVTRCNVFPNEQ